MPCFRLWSSGTKGRAIAGIGVPLNSGNSSPSENIDAGCDGFTCRTRSALSTPKVGRSPICSIIPQQERCAQAQAYQHLIPAGCADPGFSDCYSCPLGV